MDNLSSGRDTSLTGVTSQMSQNTETTGTTERDLESRESEPQKPKHVNPNANQFYASLDLRFQTGQNEEKVSDKTVGKERAEQTCTNKELVPVNNLPATDGTGTNLEQTESLKESSSLNGDTKSVHFEDEQGPTEQRDQNPSRTETLASNSMPNTPTGEQEASVFHRYRNK